MPDGEFAIFWRTIISSQVPFNISDTLTGTNVAPKPGEIIVISNISATRYLGNPAFFGIEISTIGSGGNARTQVCFGKEQEGKRLKL